jgi:hypothetical protein
MYPWTNDDDWDGSEHGDAENVHHQADHFIAEQRRLAIITAENNIINRAAWGDREYHGGGHHGQTTPPLSLKTKVFLVLGGLVALQVFGYLVSGTWPLLSQ